MATMFDPGRTVVARAPGKRRSTRSREQRTISHLVSALKQCEHLEQGKTVHAQALASNSHTNKYVGTGLINMYSRLGDIASAKSVFDRMSQRDVVSWTSCILGYVENGQIYLALETFDRMDCQPNAFTYATVLKAHAQLAAQSDSRREDHLEKAVTLHQQMKSQGVQLDVVLSNTLVDLYCKCGCLSYAREVFDQMPAKDVVSWSSLILGYVEHEHNVHALELFRSMDCPPNHVTFAAVLKACGNMSNESGNIKLEALRTGLDLHNRVKVLGLHTNLVVGTGLVDMYSMHARMDLAQEAFDHMTTRNVVSWTCLILGYVENREYLSALDNFSRMDCHPNHVTYVGVIKSITGLILDSEGPERRLWLGKGVLIHEKLRDEGLESNTVVSNSLLDMYGKGGAMYGAQDVFDRLVNRDTVSWNSLILGYAENGQSEEALRLFAGMDSRSNSSQSTNSSTLVAALKAAASLAIIPAGRDVHARACQLGLELEQLVGNSLVHMYGRCGSLGGSEHVFGGMHSPDRAAWNALIGGYSSMGDTGRVFRLVWEMEEGGHEMDEVTFMCVLGACSHAGMVDEGSAYFEEMCRRDVGLVKVEHYNCVVDMLGRANRVKEAVETARSVPAAQRNGTWLTLLGICRKWGNLEVAKTAFDALVNEKI